MQYCSYSNRLYFYHQSHLQLGVVFALALSLHSFWSYFPTNLQWHIGHLPTWGVHLSVFYLFSFSRCSWGSQGKNTKVVCNSFLPGDHVLSELQFFSLDAHFQALSCHFKSVTNLKLPFFSEILWKGSWNVNSGGAAAFLPQLASLHLQPQVLSSRWGLRYTRPGVYNLGPQAKSSPHLIFFK